jgi:hypothetical protein
MNFSAVGRDQCPDMTRLAAHFRRERRLPMVPEGRNDLEKKND